MGGFVEVDRLDFNEPHRRSMAMSSMQRRRPSSEAASAASFRRPVKAEPVEWLPRSVLKIADSP